MRAGRAWLVAGSLLLLFGLAPVALTMIVARIARAAGCRIDEGDAYPCIVLGHDWGSILYAIGEAFWLELTTLWLLPVGVLALMVGLTRCRRAGRR